MQVQCTFVHFKEPEVPPRRAQSANGRLEREPFVQAPPNAQLQQQQQHRQLSPDRTRQHTKQ